VKAGEWGGGTGGVGEAEDEPLHPCHTRSNCVCGSDGVDSSTSSVCDVVSGNVGYSHCGMEKDAAKPPVSYAAHDAAPSCAAPSSTPAHVSSPDPAFTHTQALAPVPGTRVLLSAPGAGKDMCAESSGVSAGWEVQGGRPREGGEMVQGVKKDVPVSLREETPREGGERKGEGGTQKEGARETEGDRETESGESEFFRLLEVQEVHDRGFGGGEVKQGEGGWLQFCIFLSGLVVVSISTNCVLVSRVV